MAALWLGSPRSASTQGLSPQVTLGSGFTYQGLLKGANGAPISSTCNLRFGLWNALSGGGQIGANSTVNGVSVTYGYFTALVNGGNEFGAGAFDNANARWLEVAVQCTGDGSFTVLAPRQPVSRSLATHDHFGQTWTGSSGTGLTLTGSGTGLDVTGTFTGVISQATNTTGNTSGVYAVSASASGIGVYGYATATTGNTYGVYGISSGTTGSSTWGVYGQSNSPAGYGVEGFNTASTGIGVYGYNSTTTGKNSGVFGRSDSTEGRGVFGIANATTGVNVGVEGYTNSPNGYAGYFGGDVYISGLVTKAGGGFKIDHPLDPANQYLYHSFVESPDMKDVYDGVATLDGNGEAVVQMPDWFEALNMDFRYQLTCIGSFAPVYIAQEIQNNNFRIAGGTTGMQVSWQVTGVRHDPWAEAHRIPVEQPKPPAEQGLYLHPELYGLPPQMTVNYIAPPDADPSLLTPPATAPDLAPPNPNTGSQPN